MTPTDLDATVRRGDDVSNRDGKPPRRFRIDWAAAKAFYVALEPHERSYGAVSRKFGVSDVSIGKHARAEGWAAAAAEVDNKVSDPAKDLQRAVRTREQRKAKALGLIDAFLDGMDADLEAKIAEAKVSDIPALVKLAELLEGEATDRVSQAEVSQLALAITQGHDQLVMRILTEFLPNGKRRQALEVWRDGSSEVLEVAAARTVVEAAA